MANLSTGPIENRPVGGVRPTQQVTVKMDNQDSVNSSTALVQGYFLNDTRTLYVLEEVFLTPNEVATRDYFADFDAFEFVYTTSGPAEENTRISVWGKNASEQLVTAHRLVSDELLGSEGIGPQGAMGPQGNQGHQGAAGPQGNQGPQAIPGSGRTPAFGSLYSTNNDSKPITVGENVDFDFVGPSQNVIVDTTTNTITIIISGVYEITASLNCFTSFSSATFDIRRNGNIIPGSQFLKSDVTTNVSGNTIEKTIQIALEQNDVLTVVPSAETGLAQYTSAALTVNRIDI